MDAFFPSIRELAENTVTDKFQRIKSNDQKILLIPSDAQESSRVVWYCIETEGSVVGVVSVTFLLSLYQENPDYFESMFSSITVA